MPRYRIQLEAVEVDADDLPLAITRALAELDTKVGQAFAGVGVVEVAVYEHPHYASGHDYENSPWMRTHTIDWDVHYAHRYGINHNYDRI